MPALRDWMKTTIGISLEHKTPAQVAELLLEYVQILKHPNPNPNPNPNR